VALQVGPSGVFQALRAHDRVRRPVSCSCRSSSTPMLSAYCQTELEEGLAARFISRALSGSTRGSTACGPWYKTFSAWALDHRIAMCPRVCRVLSGSDWSADDGGWTDLCADQRRSELSQSRSKRRWLEPRLHAAQRIALGARSPPPRAQRGAVHSTPRRQRQRLRSRSTRARSPRRLTPKKDRNISYTDSPSSPPASWRASEFVHGSFVFSRRRSAATAKQSKSQIRVNYYATLIAWA